MNFLTAEQIRIARQNIANDASASRIANAIFKTADAWLDRDDLAIQDLMPDAGVPRSFIVNYMTGCPVHGGGPEGYRGYAQNRWTHDPFKEKWKITCEIGGETYPSNDFEAFYRTGMQDRSLLTGPYPDDGFGWRAPGALYKHWFIAYCCRQIWLTVVSGLTALSRAYLLSDDARYAHKALVTLDRIAEVYPDMDYSTQGMFALEFSPGYTGKMFYLVSEPGNSQTLCQALDAVRDTLPDDPTFGATAEATRSRLERGIIGASLDGIYSGLSRTNYGGHQEALLVAAIVSGDQVEIDRAVDWALNYTGEATTHKERLMSFDDYIFRDKAGLAEGVEFALPNLLFREGMGIESSPSYSLWMGHLANIACLLERLGVRFWDRPKLRRMYRWPTEITCLDRFTPAIGDAENTVGGLVGLSAGALKTAYAATGDPFIGELLRRQKNRYDTFESLLLAPAALLPSKEGAAEIKQLTASSRLLGGYGLALLRSGRGKQRTAVALYYGRAATEHAHFDRLNLELFGYGRKLIPDLGYPEHAAEGDTPPVWHKNTLSHATVVVDGRRQDTQAPGRPVLFTSTDGLNLVEIDASDAYHHVSEYRRTVALIDLAPDARYVLNLFRVAGGDQHDYSTHGFDAGFSTEGIALSAPQVEGTLAGEDVPLRAIYDDDGLADPSKKGRSYYTYRGGGYSYLYDVRRGRPEGPWSAAWTDAKSNVGLRTIFLSSDEAIVAHGDPPRKPPNPKQLTYVLLRNSGDGITSRFAVVTEPFEGDPRIRAFEKIGESDQTVALKVRHQYGEDILCHAVSHSGTTFSLVRRNVEGQIVRMDLVGPGSVQAEGHSVTIEKGISGKILSVDPDTSTIDIERDRNSQPLRTRALIGETLHIHNGRRTTAYTISAVEGKGRRYRIGLNNESFRIGRFVTTGINADGSGLSTKTCLYLASQGFYRGARLVDETHSVWLPVEDVKLSPHRPKSRRDGSIALVGSHDLSAHFAAGQIAYLYDLGPGDAVSIAPRATALRRADGTFRIKGNCRAVLSG